MRKILTTTSLLLLLNTQGCVEDAKPKSDDTREVSGDYKFLMTNTAGNLISSAVKDYYEVDVALIPSAIIKDDTYLALTPGEPLGEETSKSLLSLYDNEKDRIRTGTMKGSDIKAFILKRMRRYLDVDLQVAGVRFDLQMRGGWPETFVVTRDKGLELEDDRKYRVAVSDFFYDYKNVFPGYYYGDNMNFALNLEANGYGSIKKALESYVERNPPTPPLDEPRGYISNLVLGDKGLVNIAEIQGISHLSAYRGYQVTTRGVVTAVGLPTADDLKRFAAIPDRVPVTEIIMQDPVGDGDDRTSEAISFFLDGSVTTYKVGQLVEVTGVVHEVPTVGGFSGTTLRMVDNVTVMADKQTQPAPVIIGSGGRMIGNKLPSTFPGNQNARSELNPSEAIDFWESIEGMRATMVAPRVTGVRGSSSYIEVSIIADGMDSAADRTDRGGNFYDPYSQDFNSESIKMINSPFSPAINPAKLVTDNGDQFTSNLVGIVGFNQNTFGNGRYAFYLTGGTKEEEDANVLSLANLKKNSKPTPTTLVNPEDQLTFVTWNVENLSASDTAHVTEVAGVITNPAILNCPDIVNMIEVQDNNGVEVTGGSAADRTLSEIISKMGKKCDKKVNNVDKPQVYKAINIDPVPFRDGGEFGGNIRVAMIYNSTKITFVPKGTPTATSDTFVEADGSLSQNPGRIDPRSEALEGTRKPLVAEFMLRDKRFFVIGNHWNSMLEEGSPMGAIQPYKFRTDASRSAIASTVKKFVESLRHKDPNVRVIVAGDFNTYYKSNALKTLAGDFLVNMMTVEGMCPRDQWYTTNYDGNAGAIDHIFASPGLMAMDPKFKILHINSAIQKRTSDHDPVVAQFQF